MYVYDSFSKIAKIGQIIYLTLNNTERDLPTSVSGILVDLSDDGCVLESLEGFEFFSKIDIKSWKIVKQESAGTNRPETYLDNPVHEEISDNERVELLAEPTWEIPKPEFKIPSLHDNLIKSDVNKWKNRYDYAIKVNEFDRLKSDIVLIENTAQMYSSAELFYIAGYYRYLIKDYDLSLQNFENSEVLSYRYASDAIISLSINIKNWHNAIENLIQRLEKNENSSEQKRILLSIGQCIIRSDFSELNLLDKVPDQIGGRMREILKSINSSHAKKEAKQERDTIQPEKANDIGETIKHDGDSYTNRLGGAVKGIQVQEIVKASQDDAQIPEATSASGKTVLKSLSELSILFPKRKSENEMLLPAMGNISSFYNNYYGFIFDNHDNRFYYRISDIIDPLLKRSLENTKTQHLSIPVIYTPTINNKGPRAAYIQKPLKTESLLQQAEKIMHEDPDKTLALLRQVLHAFPNHTTAQNLMEKADIKRKQKSFHKNTISYSYRRLATIAKNEEKDLQKALELFQKAFENNENRENCIKDIGMLYISMGEFEKAEKFMIENEHALPDNLTKYFFLENFYFSIKNYERVLYYINKLLKDRVIIKDDNKHYMYLVKRGVAHFNLNQPIESRESAEKALKIRSLPPNNPAERLLMALDDPNRDEHAQFNLDSDFDSFSGELSIYLKDTIENYDEFDGVPPKIIESKEFTRATLNSIRDLIDKVGRGRPRERARYLLTEIKLMQDLEPEETMLYRNKIARYCSSMAQYMISESAYMDVVRYYFLESFGLEESYDILAQQLSLYLLSFVYTQNQMFSANTKHVSIEDALKSVMGSDSKTSTVLEGVLNIMLRNQNLVASIIEKMFSHMAYRSKSIAFLKDFDIPISDAPNRDEYIKAWNQAKTKRQGEYNLWFATVKSLDDEDSLETFISKFDIILKDAKKPWIPQLDSIRINSLQSDIYDAIKQYVNCSGYRDKERYFGIARVQIEQVITEYEDKPTRLSYEGLRPLLLKLLALLRKSFAIVDEASTPKLMVSIYNDTCIVNDDNLVTIQILVETSKESSPIRSISALIHEDDGIKFVPDNNTHEEFIEGGGNHIFLLSLTVSDRIKNDKAATLNVTCRYKTRLKEEDVVIHNQLSLRLQSEDEFEPLENVYAPLADGGPVTDEGMFFGRKEFIDNRIRSILSAESKQIIIYGQKRSGKSSVLHHLKRNLEATNQVFCISFSLGLIIEDFSEYTFYHKILSEISRELRRKRIRDEDAPEYFCPDITAFRELYPTNPVNGFIDLLEDYFDVCKGKEPWAQKKLVIMIDEFTYLYTAIKRGTVSENIMKQWKAVTQNDRTRFSVVLVGQDVVPSFKNEDYARNAFGIIEDIRLTYLDEEDARLLITKPMGAQHFIGKAVDTIIDYTSRNPYYIQIFCARLVDYMNRNKILRITEADVKEVAKTFIEGSQALTIDKFDNLIRAGEEHDYLEYDDASIIEILRQIALGSKNMPICPRESISIGNTDLEDRILNHLVDREVLEARNNNYKIQVRLFKEWMLVH